MQVSKIFHPDKIHQSELRQSAQIVFQKIKDNCDLFSNYLSEVIFKNYSISIYSKIRVYNFDIFKSKEIL